MPSPEGDARCLAEACELARAAIVELQRMDDPTLWRGPAATAFRRDLAELRRRCDGALGAARAAAAALPTSTVGS